MKFIIPLLILSALILSACSELKEGLSDPEELEYHQQGVMDPASPNFHAKLVKNNSWNMNECQQCHGGNFQGGIVEVSCTNCHSDFSGPENCSTCHGSESSPAPPQDLEDRTMNTDRGVGAHQVHLSVSIIGKSVSCTECHVVPAQVHSPGHLDSSRYAEVIMQNFLANLVTNDPLNADPVIYDPTLPVFRPAPSYNTAAASCSNTYCHGAFKNGNSDNTPVWNNPASAACGSCHGDVNRPTERERALPRTVEQGGTHPGGLQCHLCHEGVIDQNFKFVNISRHMDGKVNFLGTDYKY